MYIALPRPTRRDRHLWVLGLVCVVHAALLAWLTIGRSPTTPPKIISSPVVFGRLIPPQPAQLSQPVMPATMPHAAATPPASKVHHPAPPPVSHQRHAAAVAQATPVAAAPSTAPIERATPAAAPAPTPPKETTEAVTPPLSNASDLDNPPPSYPALSKRLGESGKVLLSVLILANGSVADVTLKHSSGYPRLDAAAIAAVRQWKYHPARRGDIAVDYRYTQPITFSIND